jgi:hypothetical protein
MGKGEISPNLGLICKPLPKGGPHIVMVKSIPGVFRDMNGDIVPDEMAAEAGFDVAALKRVAAKEAAKSEALAAVEARFAKEARAIEGMSDEELGVEPAPAVANEDAAPFVKRTSSGEPRVARLVEGGPVRVIEYDNSDKAWRLFDRDTGKIYARDLSKTEAMELLVEAV